MQRDRSPDSCRLQHGCECRVVSLTFRSIDKNAHHCERAILRLREEGEASTIGNNGGDCSHP